MYTLLVHLKAKEGKIAELKNALQKLVKPTRDEQDCLAYFLHQSSEDTSEFLFYEVFKDKKAHERHCQTPHFLAWQEVMDALLAEPVKFTIWNRL